ncbi:carbohydrate binding domain-containing protein [Abditibacterium utsteinense]|nr:carbohydrate binding domain-containing protein [Abditibacterium utsteinense]
MHLKPVVFLALGLSLAALNAAHAQTRFPFAMPWNDASKTITDLSDLNPAPLKAPSRIVARDGHFFDQTGRRVRFLGTNITASAAFSKPEDSVKVAARLHKYGFNIIRLHHMDSSWPDPNIFGAGEARTTAKTEVSPQSMELLDNLVAELKNQGIYVNLNLHVGRALTAADGFEDADKLPELGKIMAYFEPRFLEIQKNYARQILGHVNRRTGLSWAKDPVVAVVELNNEDTLVGEAWSGVLQALPPTYREILRTSWNAFLKKRYASTEALKRAWAAPGALSNTNLFSNAQFGEADKGWELEVHEGAAAQMSVVDIQDAARTPKGPQGRAARIEIGQKPETAWYIQWKQLGLDLQPGAYYTLSFWARADAPRALPLGFTLDQAPWSSVGSSKTVALTPEWKLVRQVFRAGATVPNHSRLSMILGGDTGAVEVADFHLTEGASVAFDAAQSLQAGLLDLPSVDGATPGQGRDWLDFLSLTEKTYVSAMRGVIKQELGFPGPVTCSQASYGGFAGIERESASEWIDMHAYWQHPNFPGKPWDASDWNIGNTPMLDETSGGTLAELAPYRVSGKPFTVSEYNHPAPSDYASETVPLILGYAAAQDWDGVYLFDYNGDGANWNPGQIRGFFSIDSDPNKMALLPTMARAYLSGQIAPFAAKTTLRLPRGQLSILTAQTMGDGAWAMAGNVPAQWKKLGLTRHDLLGSRLELQLVEGAGVASLLRSGARRSMALPASFGWNFTGKDGQLLIDTPFTKALVGRVGDAWSEGAWPLGALQIEKPQSSNGWAAIVVTARDGLPLETSKSILVSALNRAENQGMVWNATRTSVGANWGQGPIEVETPSATLRLQSSAKSAKVWKLDATGARAGQLPAQIKNGELSFQIGPHDATPWYEIAATMPVAKVTAKSSSALRSKK